jgi:hypothetical protein
MNLELSFSMDFGGFPPKSNHLLCGCSFPIFSVNVLVWNFFYLLVRIHRLNEETRASSPAENYCKTQEAWSFLSGSLECAIFSHLEDLSLPCPQHSHKHTENQCPARRNDCYSTFKVIRILLAPKSTAQVL